MKFGIITHAIHKQHSDKIYAYEPYVREMNLWAKYVTEIKILSPISKEKQTAIETEYTGVKVKLEKIPSLHIKNIAYALHNILYIPLIFFKIIKFIKNVDHIHLRCPGNIGLLGALAQIFYPSKPKTVKYAGNWDPNSKQPVSYKIQKWILSNTILTKNCKVLVYGNWENQSKNIIPFFTASYKKNEIEIVKTKNLSSVIKFIYVGAFSVGKQPMLSVKVIEKLCNQGFNVQLNMYGNGEKFTEIHNYIKEKSLENIIVLHGNKPKIEVKQAFKESHFLLFISKSEGWPKVVAEAMFWSCLPISSNVSCVNYMLGNGSRGSVLRPDVNIEDIIFEIKRYLNDEKKYQEKVLNATSWSREYTLDKFEVEIKKILDINYE
ncbi:glycosyltransferase [Polaribacter sp. KT 15]|uniref:glycosyltransferase n=1 Tax=Polaribacter sp. KT 15 TaxID=1896175 RepID=UPI00090B8958|nr:glycosyltransferase [Polaribacter sp. KT 15]SHN09625.1 Glycosyltransferase involved in cell wall bisynthesis [Polaribacter sp. KT 15]